MTDFGDIQVYDSSEDLYTSMYCCYVETNCYEDHYTYRCDKDNGNSRGRMCSEDCAIWICENHIGINICPRCGKPLE